MTESTDPQPTSSEPPAPQQLVSWFRHSSPYINAHRGKTLVLMLPGEALDHANFIHIVHDVTLLASLGLRLVLVTGARPQIEARLQQAQLATAFAGGLRITEPAAMPAICEAVGAIRLQLESLFSTSLPNSPMHGARLRLVSGNFVTARPIGVRGGVDFQHTGNVRKIDRQGILRQLDDGAIVLLSSVGYSPTGEAFNLSYQDVATQAAIALHADKLIAFGAEPGLIHDGQLLPEVRPAEAASLLAALGDAGRDHPLAACYAACQGGVRRAHLISYADDGALLKELFTRDGAGTLVPQDSFEQIRTATIDDVGGIISLIQPLEEEGVLVRRSRELLENEIQRFTLVERDGLIVACAALYPFPEQASGELACLATHREYQGGGRAQRLLEHIERQARAQGLQQLFVLTTQTAHWFVERGFQPGSVDALPAPKKQLYNFQRNAKIFSKAL